MAKFKKGDKITIKKSSSYCLYSEIPENAKNQNLIAKAKLLEDWSGNIKEVITVENKIYYKVSLKINTDVKGNISVPDTSNNSSSNTGFSKGDTVWFNGGLHYVSSTATTAVGGTRTAGKAKITYIAIGAKRPYHLVGIANDPKGSNVYGWVDAGTFKKYEETTTPTLDTSKITSWYLEEKYITAIPVVTNNGNGDSKKETVKQPYSAPVYDPIPGPKYPVDSSDKVSNTKSTNYSKYVNDPHGVDIFTLSEEGRNLFNDDIDIWRSIMNMGIVDREVSLSGDDEKSQYNDILHTMYDRIGIVDPYNGFAGSKEYIFFTRPDLHMFKEINGEELNPELSNLTLFNDLYKRYPYIFQILQSSLSPSKLNNCPFINLLTNSVASSIQLPDVSARSLETGTNMYGTKLSYRGTSHPSDEDIQFSIDFIDNRYLEVFTLFKVYDEYMKQKHLGWITPRLKNYTVNKILSDQISIFKIVVAEDGESILYFAKWTGAYPVNVPTEAISDLTNLSGNLTFSTQWRAQFFDDFDMDILLDFNAVVRNHIIDNANTRTDIPLYDPATGMSNGLPAKYPYIAISENDNIELSRLARMRRLKLKWR